MSYVFHSTTKTFIVYIKIGKEYKQVKFRDMGVPHKHGLFSTTDKELAEAIRKSKYFGHTIFEKEREPEKVEKTKEYKYTYPAVTRTQDANRVLAEKHGVDTSDLKEKSMTIKKAEELGISFPNL